MNETMCVLDIYIYIYIYIYMERFMLVTCPRVAYVLPKCRFISILVNFEQTQYVLFLGKVMPKLYIYIYDFEACIIYFITILLVIPCSWS